MTASPTATNPATPSSLDPKVTARGRCRPTNLQLTLERECHTSVSKKPFPLWLCSDPSCWCFTLLFPSSSLLPSWLFSRCSPFLVSPGVNTGGVGSYIYDKEPSAVTQPWTFCPPLSLTLLFCTLHWPTPTVLCAEFCFLPSSLFVCSCLRQLSIGCDSLSQVFCRSQDQIKQHGGKLTELECRKEHRHVKVSHKMHIKEKSDEGYFV